MPSVLDTIPEVQRSVLDDIPEIGGKSAAEFYQPPQTTIPGNKKSVLDTIEGLKPQSGNGLPQTPSPIITPEQLAVGSGGLQEVPFQDKLRLPTKSEVLNFVSPTKQGLIDIALRPEEAQAAWDRQKELATKSRNKTITPDEEKEYQIKPKSS